MRTIRPQHWIVALGVALAAHAAVFAAWQVNPPDGTQAFGGTAIHIALASEAGTPKPESGARSGSAQKPEPQSDTQPPPNPESEPKPESEPESKSKPDPEQKSESKPAPEEEPESRTEPKLESKTEPESRQKAEPKAAPEVEPERKRQPEAEQQSRPEPKAEPEPEPEPEPQPKLGSEPHAKPERALQPEPQPEPESKPESRPQPDFKTKPEPEPASAHNPAPEPMADEKPDRQSTRNRQRLPATDQHESAPIAGESSAAGGRARAAQKSDRQEMPVTVGTDAMPPSYLDELRTRLATNKTYPYRARRLNLEGRAVFYLVINRDGELVKWSFRQRTGHEILDHAVGHMIKAATPFPPFPADMPGQRLELTIPVMYQLE